jgi:hypothetical protein
MSLLNQFSPPEARDVHKYYDSFLETRRHCWRVLIARNFSFPLCAMYFKTVRGGILLSASAMIRGKIPMHGRECPANYEKYKWGKQVWFYIRLQLPTTLLPQCKPSHCSTIRHHPTWRPRNYILTEQWREQTWCWQKVRIRANYHNINSQLLVCFILEHHIYLTVSILPRRLLHSSYAIFMTWCSWIWSEAKMTPGMFVMSVLICLITFNSIHWQTDAGTGWMVLSTRFRANQNRPPT